MSISVVGDGLLLSQKGDLVVGDGTAEGRLAVGTDGQILTASSTDSLGVKWINAPTSTQKWATIAYGEVTASVSNVTISSIPQTYSDLKLIVCPRATTTSTHQEFYIRINSISTAVYHSWWQYLYNTTSVGTTNSLSATAWQIGTFTVPTSSGTGGDYHNAMFVIDFPNYTSTSVNKTIAFKGGYRKNTTTNGYSGSVSFGNAAVQSTDAVSSIRFAATDPATGNLARDTWYVLIGIVR